MLGEVCKEYCTDSEDKVITGHFDNTCIQTEKNLRLEMQKDTLT